MQSKVFAVLAVSACALFFAATASAADSIYWVNLEGSPLSRADLAGGGGEELEVVADSQLPINIGAAIDAATGKIYWLEFGSFQINVANLDGSEQSTLSTAGAPFAFPTAIAIDPAAGRIYWIDNGPGGPSLAYAGLDGSGGGLIPTPGANFSTPLGAAIDPSLNRIYWANQGNSTIGWADLDGSESGTLSIGSPNAPQAPTGVAIDGAADRIYWSNTGSGGWIGYANLNGSESGRLDLGGAPISEPAGLAIDPFSESVYWANGGAGSISVASLAGAGGSELDTTGAPINVPEFPMLLLAPSPRSAAPLTPSIVDTGATLTCPGVAWQPDLVESQLYEAPERTAISWTFEGAPIEGATGSTLVASQAGTYACQVTASNAAGSTTVPAGVFVANPSTSTVTSGSNSSSVPGPGATAPRAPRPSHRSARKARLKITKVEYDKVDGTATVLVKTSGPGRVAMSGKGMAGAGAKVSGDGMAKLKVVAAGKARKALRRTGTAKVTVTIKFAGSRGDTASKTQALTLRRQLSGP
jgi:DNA-binding beta-propeller fold protein YncE